MDRIRLGYLHPFRPFCWEEDGVARGRFVDALCERLPPGVALDWRPGPVDVLPRWLAEGRIDAIAAKAITPGRAGAFAFSEPLMQTAAALFGRAPALPPAIGAAGRARIATPAAGPLADLLAQLAPGARVLAVESYAAAFDAVCAGRAEWAALNADAGAAQRPEGIGAPGPRFAALGLAVAVKRGDPEGVLGRLGLARLSGDDSDAE